MFARFTLLALALFTLAAGELHAQAAPEAGGSLQSGMDEGTTAAEAAGTGFWALSGFTGGLVLGPIGASLVYTMAGGSASSLPTDVSARIKRRDAEFQLGFQQAYTRRLSARRRSAAIAGGASGAALMLVSSVAYLTRAR